MTADDPRTAARRLGGYARAAKLTPEERAESARKAVQARWAKVDAERAAAGLPPTRKTPQPLDAEALAYWCAIVDERFGADYPWKNAMSRKRQAIAMAREEFARRAAEAFAERRKRGDV